MKTLNKICEQITVLETLRDGDLLDQEGIELLAVLNLCYDLLSRTRVARKETVRVTEEMKEEGFEQDMVLRYGITANELADFAFSISTQQGTVDLRKLLQQIRSYKTQAEIASALNIRQATISEYLTGKRSMFTDTYENIINHCISS